MLARTQSLKNFSRNFPKSTSSGFFIVNTRPSQKSKFIVTVPKKTCPLAVDRNRSRRLVTAALLDIFNKSIKPQEVAILVRRNLKETTLAVVKSELKKLF